MLAQHTRLSEADRRFLQGFLPDAEDAPWMAVTNWHLIALIAALLPLRWFAAASRPDWYVGSGIAVWYPLPEGGRNYVVPDIFVALAPSHLRTSFDSEREGGLPTLRAGDHLGGQPRAGRRAGKVAVSSPNGSRLDLASIIHTVYA